MTATQSAPVSSQNTLVIGTRESPLAMAQAHEVRNLLLAAHPDLKPENVSLLPMTTRGDQILDRTLAAAGGKGLFTKELEVALLERRVDLVVHSSKDMPTQLPEGLELSAFLKREDRRDVLISRSGGGIADLPSGATVGTASLRRQAQVLRMRPDLKVIPFRGNVQTRLKKLKEGQADATFLALAGLNRLDMADVASETLSLDVFPTAPAQGAITLETRTGDTAVTHYTNALDHWETHIAVVAERAFLGALDGSCRTPIAAESQLDGSVLSLRGLILSLDGSTAFEVKGSMDMADSHLVNAKALGKEIGEKLREDAGDDFFEALINAIDQL